VLVAADGLDAGGEAPRLAVEAVARKSAILDKLARATDQDRRSGARLALGRTLERLFAEIHAQLVARKEGAALGVVVVSGGYAHLAHVGATRAYLLRDGRVRQLTEDHTLGMVRVRQGELTTDEYRASPLRDELYQALGAGAAAVDVDFSAVGLADGDVLLLCTSGLYRGLDDAALARGMAAGSADDVVRNLVAACGRPHAAAVAVRIASDAPPAELDAMARALSSTALFADLSEAERLLVAPYLDPVALEAGAVLFEEGAPADAFYVVVDGRVRVERGGTPLTEIGPGGSFGELCLAGPKTTRSAGVVAVAPTRLLGLRRDRFDEIVARRPAVGNKLLVRSLRWIGERLRDLTERLANVERLAVGELKPGDLALRTAIVLAARGEWGG
jgi:CRP-like cAMP-binding protein/serine/threonine protein phosphatase PrpC